MTFLRKGFRMKTPNITTGIALVLLVGASAAVSGMSWTCQSTGLVRHVLVIYPEAPDVLPCQVFYAKPNENVVPRQLWQANSTKGYCEDRAAELVSKLGSLGWHCTLDEAAETAGN